MTSQDLDPRAAQAFVARMVDIINGGALSLMISIGHRAGLFDVMRGLEAATSRQIAEEAGLEERYVREWLGAMVTGGIVRHDPHDRSYRLPAEHAAVLTREARPGNMAVSAQWIPLLGRVEDEILACFERGGGVPYASYQRFHQVMAEESDQTTVAALLDAILPLAPGLMERLGEGLDVLDVGCGAGRAANLLARTFPKSRFCGYDLSPEAVSAARAEALQDGLANVHFEVRDVADLEVEGAFDLALAFDAIHDQARPGRVLAAIGRALRPGGTFLMQEVRGTSHLHKDAEHPLAPFLYTVSCLHCTSVSLACGGAGLGAMWGEERAREMLALAGFADVELHLLPHDVINQYFLARRPG
jgi:2-polyprenyl-3-methyl-5-hydroxy-6-metoxy-1,4-benzoquinol methylase